MFHWAKIKNLQFYVTSLTFKGTYSHMRMVTRSAANVCNISTQSAALSIALTLLMKVITALALTFALTATTVQAGPIGLVDQISNFGFNQGDELRLIQYG
jgi:hypothetical protein